MSQLQTILLCKLKHRFQASLAQLTLVTLALSSPYPIVYPAITLLPLLLSVRRGDPSATYVTDSALQEAHTTHPIRKFQFEALSALLPSVYLPVKPSPCIISTCHA